MVDIHIRPQHALLSLLTTRGRRGVAWRGLADRAVDQSSVEQTGGEEVTKEMVFVMKMISKTRRIFFLENVFLEQLP